MSQPSIAIVTHTPGPWTADEPGRRFRHDNSAGVQGPNGMYVATALDFNRTDRDAEVEANVRLIAASPELLEALRSLCDDFEATVDPADETTAPARALIAKATGVHS